MLDPTLAAAFLLVALAVALSPGPDVMFVLASGMRHKTRGAVASAVGITILSPTNEQLVVIIENRS